MFVAGGPEFGWAVLGCTTTAVCVLSFAIYYKMKLTKLFRLSHGDIT